MNNNAIRSIVLLTFLVTFSVSAKALKITTWNLEHLQSELDYLSWVWQCQTDPENRPANMTYCGALDGMSWTSKQKCDFVKGKNLSTDLSAYQEKVKLIKYRLKELSSDVFAFQELNSLAALEQLFVDVPDYELSISNSPSSNLHVGYAIRKNLKPKFNQRNEFVVDTCNTPRAGDQCSKHTTRPGLEARIEFKDRELVLLNLHLKSGCQFYPIDDLTEDRVRPHKCETMDERLDRIITGCTTLRKQIPILEQWIETQVQKNPDFIILGDFNRNMRVDLGFSARSDNTDKTDKISSKTKITSLIKEVSDGSPSGASFILGEQQLVTKEIGGYSSCWTGIDWIGFSSNFAKKHGWSFANKPKLVGKDFRPYTKDRAIASDHCPVSVDIKD